ncbi:HD domain-containing protein [Limnohabitans sp. Rim11]|jgi:(p)ppGpp synthase/HD superfamily hydrolase|uniref:HD domain-containing protein n=1 Tax=Limnohabitans sp. Rim11 TaxID=1100719 RepID=UPI000AD23394|nr:HD domain-containing protein [Limnohabitans sp. Rim11]
MQLSKLASALDLAIQAHQGQVRKSTTIPYISHPMAVASIALEFGATEDQAIAALLHDAIEDGGIQYANIIKAQFGDHVHNLVQGCTDGTPDASGKKAPWLERKTAYLHHLEAASDEVLLVSCSDKLHNARAIVSDLINEGPSMFNRFSSTTEQTLWYYRQLAMIFNNRKTPPAKALEAAVSQMEALSQSAW